MVIMETHRRRLVDELRNWMYLIQNFLWRACLFCHFVLNYNGWLCKVCFPLTLQLIWWHSTSREPVWDGEMENRGKGLAREAWLVCLPLFGLPVKGEGTICRGSAVQEFPVETTSKWAGAFNGGEESEATLSGKLTGECDANHSFSRYSEESDPWSGRRLEGYHLPKKLSRQSWG